VPSDNLIPVWSSGCQIKEILLYSVLSIFAESFQCGVLRVHSSWQFAVAITCLLHQFSALCCCEILVPTCQTSQHHNPVDCTISHHILENLISSTQSTFFIVVVEIKALEALCVREQNKNC
jgi:hypothetical protein